jgi:hypothetical protein
MLLWGNQIQIQAQSAATVWVTGLCTPSAQVYGGQCIASVPLAAGQTQVFSLATARAGVPVAAGRAAWGPGPAIGGNLRRERGLRRDRDDGRRGRGGERQRLRD